MSNEEINVCKKQNGKMWKKKKTQTKCWKISFLATKSVSQLSSIRAALLWVWERARARKPSVAVRADFLDASTLPLFLSSVWAASMSQLDSISAAFTSFMGALVRSLNCFIRFVWFEAEEVSVVNLLLLLLLLQVEFGKSLALKRMAPIERERFVTAEKAMTCQKLKVRWRWRCGWECTDFWLLSAASLLEGPLILPSLFFVVTEKETSFFLFPLTNKRFKNIFKMQISPIKFD